MTRGLALVASFLVLLVVGSLAPGGACYPTVSYSVPSCAPCPTPCYVPCVPVCVTPCCPPAPVCTVTCVPAVPFACGPVVTAPAVCSHPTSASGNVTAGSIILVVDGSDLADIKVTIDNKDAKQHAGYPIYVSGDTVGVDKEVEYKVTGKSGSVSFTKTGKVKGDVTERVAVEKKPEVKQPEIKKPEEKKPEEKKPEIKQPEDRKEK